MDPASSKWIGLYANRSPGAQRNVFEPQPCTWAERLKKLPVQSERQWTAERRYIHSCFWPNRVSLIQFAHLREGTLRGLIVMCRMGGPTLASSRLKIKSSASRQACLIASSQGLARG